MQRGLEIAAPYIRSLARRLWESMRDLLPIVFVVVGFQTLVLRQPFPNVAEVLVGAVFVVFGLMLFVQGLEMGLFPIGEAMAYAFARKGSLVWLLVFGFLLGFSTTVAEPALIAIAGEAASVASDGGYIASDAATQSTYALQLRLTVALSVGAAIVIGVLRILRGWPVQYLIIGGYVIVVGSPSSPPSHRRHRLRLRRCDHVDGDGAAGHGARGRARDLDPRPRPAHRRLRDDCSRVFDSDDLRHALRNHSFRCSRLGGGLMTSQGRRP